jgi:signal recognition particle subunit SRP54
MLCGLQGAGKTTMAAKLAGYLTKQGKKPMLAACDIYRPAAIKQLQVVGQQVKVPVFEKGTQNPVQTAKEAVEQARYYGRDVLIIDTAGRLHIDEELMEELAKIRAAVKPQEILLVVDAMTGQDAVNVAKSFNEKLELGGVILTKLDGDTRGGAALSVRAVTGKPIKFAGIGEKLQDIEPFHPERMASRILGMGDVMTLIEKAQEAFDEKEADKLARKTKVTELTLEDFLENMQQMKKMGPLQNVLGMLPGVGTKLKDVQIDDNALKKPEAIIRSMTPRERRNPDILNASRRKRIAAGSGTTVQDVNALIRQFEQARQMMKQVMNTRKGGGKGRMRLPF